MIEQPPPLTRGDKTVLGTVTALLAAGILGGAAWGINQLINDGAVHKTKPDCVSISGGALPEDVCPTGEETGR